MPIIRQANETPITEKGDGWQAVTLADEALFGAPAMVARRLILEAGARTPDWVHGQTEQLLYVIRGGGAAVVDGAAFELAPESVLWLEPGERYYFRAGEAGLEILQGFTPRADQD